MDLGVLAVKVYSTKPSYPEVELGQVFMSNTNNFYTDIIRPMDLTRIDTDTPGESRSGNNDNKGYSTLANYSETEIYIIFLSIYIVFSLYLTHR